MLKTVISFLYLLFSNDISVRKRNKKMIYQENRDLSQTQMQDARINELKLAKQAQEKKIRELRAAAVKGDFNAHGEWLQMIKIARKNAGK